MISILLFAATLGVYLLTAAPTITWAHDGADGAELATAIAVGGTAHPPGYPTYLLLGRVFGLLPVGDLAYRLNVMSAVAAALAVLFVYLLTVRLLERPGQWRVGWVHLCGAVAALGLAFSGVFWSQAVIAEVYAPNAFFVAASALLLAFGSPRLAAFVVGVGLGNHPTLLFWGIGLAIVARREGFGLREMALPLLAGLAVYFYLPLAGLLSAFGGPLAWQNPASLDGFWWTMSGGPYRSMVFGLPLEYLPGRLASFAALLGQQFTPLGLVLGLLGLGYLAELRPSWALGSAVAFVLTAVYAVAYNAADSYVYLIPCFVVLALWLGAGLLLVVEGLAVVRDSDRWRRALLVAVPLLLPSFLLGANFDAMNLRDDREAIDYAAAAFAVAEPRAVVLADTDRHIFALWYYRYTVATESDVAVVAQPLLGYDWYRDSLRGIEPRLALEESSLRLPDADSPLAFVAANRDLAPIYITDPWPELESAAWLTAVEPLYRVEKLY